MDVHIVDANWFLRDELTCQKWPIPPVELQRRQATSLYEIEMFFREEELSDFI